MIPHKTGHYRYVIPHKTGHYHWRGFGGDPVCVPDYYRSFADVINPIIRSGFQIREIVETRPIPELKEIQPDRYKKYENTATFMVLDLSKT